MASYSEERGKSTSALRYPRTHQEWVDLKCWLQDAYVADPYSARDLREMHLFRALDDNGDEMAITRRIIQDAQHIVNTDASALSGGEKLSLGANEGSEDKLDAGRKIWKRSKVTLEAAGWALQCAMKGDVHIEAALIGGKAKLIHYPPECVRVDYHASETTRLIRAVITIRYFDPPAFDSNGIESDGVMHHYQRVLTETEVVSTLDGRALPTESGPHGLGVVPMVHVPFLKLEPEHGLPAAWGAWRAIAAADSVIAEVAAIATRSADPKIVVTGAELSSGTNGAMFGRYFHGLPKDATIQYLESSLSGASTALEFLTKLREMIRENPEFLFTESGANASGTSLNFRATSFVAKMQPIRSRFFEALATVTQFALAIETRRALDEDEDWFYVAGSPILPVSKTDEVALLLQIKQAGGLSDGDLIRALQALDYVGDQVDPDEYAEQIRRDTSAFVDAVGGGKRAE